MNLNTLQKKIKLIFFDIDGVLFDVADYKESSKKVGKGSCSAVFDQAGIYNEHERLKEMFIKGYFPSYTEWTDEACRVLQKHGLTKEKFMKIINGRPLMSGAKETLNELRKRGYKTVLITGTFKALAKKAEKLLGLDSIIAHCDLIFDEKGHLKEWKLIPCDFEGKIEYLNKLAMKFNLSPQECAYIGDEVNDVAVLKKAGLSIAFNSSKKEVKEAAHIIIDKKYLREILKYFPPII